MELGPTMHDALWTDIDPGCRFLIRDVFYIVFHISCSISRPDSELTANVARHTAAVNTYRRTQNWKWNSSHTTDYRKYASFRFY